MKKEKKQDEETSPAQLEDQILMETGSSLQETESPEHEVALLKSGTDEETVESSKALSIGKDRIRLSGAARQRFKYLIKQGLPAEEARVKSVEPVKKESTSDKGHKRSETKTIDGQPKKTLREAERGSSASMPTKPTFSQVTGDVKVGILPKNYPEVLLTMEQMESMKGTILDKIIESGKKAATKPHYHSSHNRPGWVALMCADNTTIQWLKSTIEDIKPWEGAELRVLEEAEMPQRNLGSIPTWKPGILHGENPWINRGSKLKCQRNELEGTKESIRGPSRTPNGDL
ncbi:hypothetical protein JTB14_008971 [Gonioctena quinquepunctata]|nr:hypothetical protein JTB14_008971 [Gonioctena quinquepunctata]